MTVRAILTTLVMAAGLAVPASAVEEDAVSKEAAHVLPDSLQGIYSSNRRSCHNDKLSIEGKVAIRGGQVFVEGGTMVLDEVLAESKLSLEGNFLPPGGYGAPLRMSFVLWRPNKLIVRIYDGQMDPPMMGYRRCPEESA